MRSCSSRVASIGVVIACMLVYRFKSSNTRIVEENVGGVGGRQVRAAGAPRDEESFVQN